MSIVDYRVADLNIVFCYLQYINGNKSILQPITIVQELLKQRYVCSTVFNWNSFVGEPLLCVYMCAATFSGARRLGSFSWIAALGYEITKLFYCPGKRGNVAWYGTAPGLERPATSPRVGPLNHHHCLFVWGPVSCEHWML